MAFKGLLCALLALCFSNAVALNVVNSSWIGTVDNTSVSSPAEVINAFRRDFASPSNKTALSSQILIAANNYTLYVNGELLGQGNDWETTHQYCVGLNASQNVFAVGLDAQVTDLIPPVFIGAIQVNYDDNSSDVILTDANWLSGSAVDGFQNIDFDDSMWLNATIEGNSTAFIGHVPYGPYNSSSVSLDNSSYIFANVSSDSTSLPPPGPRAFRKTADVLDGSLVSSGTAIIVANENFTLYINGELIGSGSGTTTDGATLFNFTLSNSTSHVVVAVNATTMPIEPTFIGAIAFDAVDYSCSGTLFNITTDGTWKFNLTAPLGFEQPDFDDSSWQNVTVQGPLVTQV